MKKDVKSKKLYKNDFLLIIAVIIVLVVLSLPLYFSKSTNANSIAVLIDGKEYTVLSLSEDSSTDISDTGMVLCIENGVAFVTETDCPDKTCMSMSINASSTKNESIICIPNRVVIKKTSDNENGKGVNVIAG